MKYWCLPIKYNINTLSKLLGKNKLKSLFDSKMSGKPVPKIDQHELTVMAKKIDLFFGKPEGIETIFSIFPFDLNKFFTY